MKTKLRMFCFITFFFSVSTWANKPLFSSEQALAHVLQSTEYTQFVSEQTKANLNSIKVKVEKSGFCFEFIFFPEREELDCFTVIATVNIEGVKLGKPQLRYTELQ